MFETFYSETPSLNTSNERDEIKKEIKITLFSFVRCFVKSKLYMYSVQAIGNIDCCHKGKQI